MSKAVVIYNPSAGAAGLASETVAQLADRYGCELRLLNAPNELESAIVQSAADGAQRIIVAGGDGSVGHAVNALLPNFPDVELGILPLGTANDLARSLDLPLGNVELALEIAATRQAVRIDVVEVRNGGTSYFVNAATGGFGGEVTAALSDTNKQLWGPFSYWMTAMSKLANLHAYDIELALDAEQLNLRVYGIGLANGRYAGGGFPVGASAMLDDGLMDLIVIPELPTLELLGAGINYILGTQEAADSGVLRRQARKAVIRTVPAMSYSFDGEPTKAVDASFEVLPGALRIVAGDEAALVRS